MRSLHMFRMISPVCEVDPTGKHAFIVLQRADYDPPDQVQMQCDDCGSAAYFLDEPDEDEARREELFAAFRSGFYAGGGDPWIERELLEKWFDRRVT